MTRENDPSVADEHGERVTPDPREPTDKSAELRESAPASSEAGAVPEAVEALQVLTQAVRQLLERHKQPRAAGVKSEMQKIISGNFDQSAYGYGSFREFVDNAAESGTVVVVDTVGSQPGQTGDPLITLPGREVDIEAPVPRPARRRGRVRPDVWRAFTSWEAGYTRLWDLETDRILMFPTEPRPLEPSEHRLWRQLAASEPERFRAIEVIDEDQLVAEMRSFTQSLDQKSDAIPILNTALQQARPARSFTTAARALPGIAEKWKQRRFDFVWAAITKWQESNGIHSPIEDDSGRRQGYQTSQRTGVPTVMPSQIAPRQTGTLSEAAAAATRERIFAALSRMPLSELLRLRVPVEYLIDL
jgi:hypothetical protein